MITKTTLFPSPGAFLSIRTSSIRLNAVNEETQKLLDQAAQARAEAAQLEEELAKTRPPTPTTKISSEIENNVQGRVASPTIEKKSISAEDLIQKLQSFEMIDAKSTSYALQQLNSEGFCTRWNCAEIGQVWQVSQGQLKRQTGIDGKTMNAEMNLDELKYALGAVVAFSAVSAVLSGSLIGGNVGATFTYIFALLPIIFLGIGSSAPGVIIAAINLIKGNSDAEFSNRRVVHEAAHFLAGYLLGLPIKSYKVDGPTTEVEFFDTLEGDQVSLNRMLTNDEIIPLSIVAMAGAVAEIKEYKTATGSAQDLEYLGQLMVRTRPVISNSDQENITRWAALEASRLVSKHSKELEALVKAFSEKKTVPECIAALESV